MRFAIPIYALVEVRDEAEAEAVRQKMEKLLAQPMVRMAAAGQGVNLQGVTTDKAYVVQPGYVPPAASGTRR